MPLNESDLVFSSFRDACACAKDVALKTGRDVQVNRTSNGWTVPGGMRKVFPAEKPPEYKGSDRDSGARRMHEWTTLETRDERESRIAEMKARADGALDEKIRRELDDSLARSNASTCAACDRPLHACRCGL